MLPYYSMPPYAGGNYLTEQSIRGYNYPFSTAYAASPVVDGYYPSTQAMVPPPEEKEHRIGFFEWLSELDVVDSTLILAGICLTVLFVCGMVTGLIQDGMRAIERKENEERPNFFQRLFQGKNKARKL
ncbi:MAG: hypothetical protein NTW61_07735 [Candidatus Melainabacteria bacterium]|nr:hypothetical protein [Candidatus Melainabacteria bacterium]